MISGIGIVLIVIGAILLGASITMLYVTSANFTAGQFIQACDSLMGSGNWRVDNGTCVPIRCGE